MLKEFRIKNFKSINEEQVFTMEACPKSVVSEYYKQHVVERGKEKLLKISSFYGPNGGGKSNLIKAFSVLRSIVVGSQYFANFGCDKPYLSSLYNKDKEITLELFVVLKDKEIGYSVSFVADKIYDDEIIYPQRRKVMFVINREEMIYRFLKEKDTHQIFLRDGDRIESNLDSINEIDIVKNRKKLSENMSFVRYINDTFEEISDPLLLPIFEFSKELSSAVLLSKDTRTVAYGEHGVEKIKPFIPKIVKLLNAFDLRIKDIVFKKNQDKMMIMYIERITFTGDKTYLPLSSESSGTRKMIEIILDIVMSENASIYLADDFDSFLHPKLVRGIIELFASEDNQTKQLIMNSHDFINMNNLVFRRDEIWFAFRNEEYSTIYMPLSNIVDYKGEMIRKDARYSKQYLEGKYGADPFIQQGLSWKEI